MSHATPRIAPYLLYEDLDTAMDWLAKAFGFRERMRLRGPDGKTRHAEMELAKNDGVIMLGSPGPEYRNPKRLGQVTHHLYVRVEGLDAFFERAKLAGGVVLEQPADQPYGERRCAFEDPEGHTWYFAQPLTRGE